MADQVGCRAPLGEFKTSSEAPKKFSAPVVDEFEPTRLPVVDTVQRAR